MVLGGGFTYIKIDLVLKLITILICISFSLKATNANASKSTLDATSKNGSFKENKSKKKNILSSLFTRKKGKYDVEPDSAKANEKK